jgi:hypothetical protein
MLVSSSGPLLFRNDGDSPSRRGAGFEFHDRSDQAPDRDAADVQGGRHPSELSEATTPRFGQLGCLNRLHRTPVCFPTQGKLASDVTLATDG